MRFLAFIFVVLVPASAFGQELKILAWNIQSWGSDLSVIEKQLEEMRGQFDVLALSEVSPKNAEKLGRYFDKAGTRDDFAFGSTGGDDRLFVAYDHQKLKAYAASELKEFEGVTFGEEDERAPQMLTLELRKSGQKFVLLNNHLARGEQQMRNLQARALVEWARNQSLPVIAVGQYNMDYDFPTQKGNDAFSIFQRDGIFKWVKPDEFIDTNWADHNKDGKDDFPDSMLDFVFVAGAAKDWEVRTKVIVRDGDFPDDKNTSDHRATLTTVIVK